MAEHTKIEWTDATWNPITGCSVVSPGCTNCYAMRLAGTRMNHHPSRAGLTIQSKAGPVWTGDVRLNEEWLTQPLRWSRPRMIFVCAHGDLFHESVPDEWIDRVFAVMALAPQHTFQVLTKRAQRMRVYFAARTEGDPWAEAADAIGNLLGTTHHPAALEPKDMPLQNVWLGVSVEDQRRADERIPELLETPAALRWLSAEPLLGPIDLEKIDVAAWMRTYRSGSDIGQHPYDPDMRWPLLAPFEHMQSGWSSPGLDWVVVGGESGPGARPMHPDWPRAIRDQCERAGVPFFFKQWGEWAVDRLRPGSDLGGDMRADRVRHVCRDRENDGYFREGDRHMRRVGKARAGRKLDGEIHDAQPAVWRGDMGEA